MKRIFIAADLEIPVVERLALLCEELEVRTSEVDARIRWVAPENIHVTLQYLGETDPALIGLIEERLTQVTEPLFPFEVTCERLGVFPEATNARIIWAGLDPNGAEVIGLLRQAIVRDLENLGVDADEREYKPHVTLGRVRSTTKCDLSEVISDFEAVSFGRSYVKDLILFESELTPSGARYRVLHRFPLGHA